MTCLYGKETSHRSGDLDSSDRGVARPDHQDRARRGPAGTGFFRRGTIDWRLDEGGPAAKRQSFDYPPSEMLRLEAIGETVPVYQGHIQIRREITFGQEAVLKPLVTATGEVIVKGSFRYQACDDRKCYVPEAVPLLWRFKYEGLDRQRAPSEFQRKPN